MNTYAEISLDAIKHNIAEIKKLISGQTRFMAVTKANAYGHGAAAVSRAAIEAGVDYLAVANLREALELREAGVVHPILILTESPTSVMDEIVQHQLTQTVYSFSEAKALSDEAVKRKRAAKVHVKVDTGMGRLGVLSQDAAKFVKKIHRLKFINIEGIFTHFALADMDEDFTFYQIDLFNRLISHLNKDGIYISLLHAANSMGVIGYKDSHFNMVRPGLAIYGLYPAPLSRTSVLVRDLQRCGVYFYNFSLVSSLPP